MSVSPEKVAYSASRVLPDAHAEPMVDASVVVEDGRVVAVTRRAGIPSGYPEVDLGDRWLLPGMIDLHVHLVWDGSAEPLRAMQSESAELTAIRCVQRAHRHLVNGVTTVRDVGGPHRMVLAARSAIEDGVASGARVLAAGSPIVMTGGHGHEMGVIADGVDGVRWAVRSMLAEHVDLIKVMAGGGVFPRGERLDSVQLGLDELTAAVTEAHNNGRRVAAHAHGLRAIKNSIVAGVDTIEHSCFLDAEAAALAKENDQVIVPTLVAFHRYVELGTENGLPAHPVEKAGRALTGGFEAVGHARAAGVPVGAGTDAGGRGKPHGCLAAELELLVKAGLTPREALAAATTVAASACGRDDLGALRAGAAADLIATEADPTADIGALTRIDTVIAGGTPVVRDGRPVLGTVGG